MKNKELDKVLGVFAQGVEMAKKTMYPRSYRGDAEKSP
jgi:hypothetical protein